MTGPGSVLIDSFHGFCENYLVVLYILSYLGVCGLAICKQAAVVD
jgi:hypothetical protein